IALREVDGPGADPTCGRTLRRVPAVAALVTRIAPSRQGAKGQRERRLPRGATSSEIERVARRSRKEGAGIAYLKRGARPSRLPFLPTFAPSSPLQFPCAPSTRRTRAPRRTWKVPSCSCRG